MPKKVQILLPALLAGVMVVGMLIGLQMQPVVEPHTTRIDTEQLMDVIPLGRGKVEEIIRYIDAKYVEEVDREELVEEAIEQLLSELDPHSTYISAEELRLVNEQLEGNFEGIGIEFMIVDDTVRVVAALAGGPSEAAGILPGDRIVSIADSVIAGIGIDSEGVIQLLRGEEGTEVDVGILRGDERTLRRFHLKRARIPVKSVDAAYMVAPHTGYIKVNRFSANTYREFMEGLERLVEKEGMKHLIIDLRQNPGGYLQEAVKMLSQLFPEEDKLLVYTEGDHVSRTEYKTTGRPFYDVGKVVVLIDEGSASASEIVAGAIQDWDRGWIIGRRSFGKGLVQEQYMLRDGSALRLTVARYYTPSGRCIQRPYDDPEAYDEEVMHRYEHGEMLTPDSIHFADTTHFFTQSGRLVYGGGGIMPDIFIPIDTVQMMGTWIELRQYVPEFAFRYATGHSERFAGMDFDRFRKNFRVDEPLLQEFLAFAKKEGAEPDPADLPVVKPVLRRLLEARLARQLFGEEAFYKIWNEDDPAIRKAIEVIQSSEEGPAAGPTAKR